MGHGLMWFPLLALFIGLAWAGWNEYQKLEAYKVWASDFERAKYDIYAMLGQTGDRLTWGKPTRRGPVDLHHLAIADIVRITVIHGSEEIPADQFMALEQQEAIAQSKRRIQLALYLRHTSAPACIPFTELPLALKWGLYLERHRQQLTLSPDA
ncbi:MAG TPA: hypothetical protein V6D20_09335 [Candidatus Obscuribacterales bacterium]